jgi:DNA-damage-inducible protein J
MNPFRRIADFFRRKPGMIGTPPSQRTIWHDPATDARDFTYRYTEAESILDQIGLSSSDAIRMFYKQITMRKGLPFDARVPNTTTREALRDAEAGRNLTRYADADDLFRKLGVKSGKS